MANDIWSIFLNLVAAFIYAGIVKLWTNRGKQAQLLPQPAPTEELKPSGEPNENWERNKRALETGAQAFLFYFVTFAALYLSITMPALFKALFTKEPVLLSQARHIGEFLPSIPVGKDYLQVTFFITAAIIYWPLLILSETITSLLYPLLVTFGPVTKRVWNATTMLCFLLFCIPVAATSIWFFYEKTYSDSLITVVIFIFLAFAVGQGGRR